MTGLFSSGLSVGSELDGQSLRAPHTRIAYDPRTDWHALVAGRTASGAVWFHRLLRFGFVTETLCRRASGASLVGSASWVMLVD